MFSHIMVGARDMQEAKVFYDAALGALGYEPGVIDEMGRCFYVSDGNIFAVTIPINGEPACHGNGSTIGFVAADSTAADNWHAAGIANGGATCEDPPGVRDGGNGKIYLAYLRDPSGNKLCAVYRMG
ncbi:MAG: glyoxalase [Gammaproteobacteria bacterium]|jgi:catechol 2,3-dioxygenase-like lactoylglutathione lyase family enzyme|nr:glyoxalase [Gammaproteobacteria bacterium]|tara:strand:+ start:732 stop:1112 length:381 start_codon:yes stop_codon:yes gene_type:complete